MIRILAALLLGILSFILFFSIVLLSLIGEGAINSLGDERFIATLLFMAAYYFICQRWLSRGLADAPRKDWPIMLVLNAVPLVLVILTVIIGKWPANLFLSFTILMAGWGGAFAGAVVASRAARKRQGAQ